MRAKVEAYMRNLQDEICSGLERIDQGGRFIEDKWERPGGGGGKSRVIIGSLIEKGGVNFSAVHGLMPERISAALSIPANEFFATGVSIVLHPVNPWIPIIHLNVRYFETDSGHSWFGGGIDITPHYINVEDSKFFHNYLKSVCDQYSQDAYSKFKKWADEYFYIRHRKETRGVGGIFFDRLTGDKQITIQGHYEFVQKVGKSFLPIYRELTARNKDIEYNYHHRDWQLHRRGRYVEFNLVCDKGTKFGLDTEGRTESILMSMPPDARWSYNHHVIEGSLEDHTLKLLKKDIDWINYNSI